MDVWILTREEHIGYGSHEEITVNYEGVYTTLESARLAANTSTFAMSSKDGIQWEDEFIGGVETCRKGHYYMLCSCSKFDRYVYSIVESTLEEVR